MHLTIARLRDAMNAHDADALAALFAPEYRSEQPAHPARGFGGSAQVRANWSNMFAGVPNLTAEIRDALDDGETTWTEWEWRGAHPDGSAFAMRGVTVMGVGKDGAFTWARLYMEPVEEGGAAIEEAVFRLSGAPR